MPHLSIAHESSPHLQRVQTAPNPEQIAQYHGLHAAVAHGDPAKIEQEIQKGADLDAVDPHGRTPLMVAAYRRDLDAARNLIDAGANVDALDRQQYDALTIAAVNDDAEMVKLLINAGADASAITSPYQGTALIAAAHLGHVDVVDALIAAKAPLDHVNNLGWTALIEAIVLGDGGPRHVATVRSLVAAGADVDLADEKGMRPLRLARQRGYSDIVDSLERAGARP